MHVRHLVGSCGRTGTAGPQATPALQLVHEGVVIFDLNLNLPRFRLHIEFRLGMMP